jgi:hypothetical protein
MLKIAVVSITYRTLNNIASVLQGLVAGGARCDVIWAPTSQGVDGQSPRSFGLDVGLDFTGLQAKNPQGLADFAAKCRTYLEALEPDLVISDDMTTWPNRIVYEIVRALPGRPWQLAWQHGLHQPWYEMRQRFDADFFLCYGRIHAFLMGEALAPRVFPVGLPKLDRLGANGVTPEGGYLAWFAQPLPEARLQIELLADVAKATRLPVRIRPHPAAPRAFAAATDLEPRGLQIDDPSTDPIETLRHCTGFLSTHSSAAVEALLLGKSAVLFPSFGLTSFPGFPNVASDFTARAYQVALKRCASRGDATEAFLVDCVGGRRIDHTSRGLRVIEAIGRLRREGVSIANVGERQVDRLRQLAGAESAS